MEGAGEKTTWQNYDHGDSQSGVEMVERYLIWRPLKGVDKRGVRWHGHCQRMGDT